MKKILFYASAIAVMFSSCSKDATEVTAPSLEGQNVVFSAKIAVENDKSTRLYLNEEGDYVWNAGDGIGVSSLENNIANVPAYTATETKTPNFVVDENDYRYFGDWKEGEDALIAYYPYAPGNGPIDQTGKVTVSIPQNQRYAPNSFYKNTVPAVGYVEKYLGADTEIAMKVPVSMIRVYVSGVVKTSELKLQAYDQNGNEHLLYGSGLVDPTLEKPALTVNADPQIQDKSVKLTFGNLPEQLQYEGNLPVYFVIPADLQISKLVLSCGEDTEEYDGMPAGAKTKPNTIHNIGKKPFVFGMDGKYVIRAEKDADKTFASPFTAEEMFIAYAYLTRPGVVANPVAPAVLADCMYIAKALGVELSSNNLDLLKTVVSIYDAELNFEGYDKDWAKTEYDWIQNKIYELGSNITADQAEKFAFWKNVYEWYHNNDAAIESLSYNGVEGFVGGVPGTPVTIKNLKVKGNGLTAGASLSNLVLEDITVVANGQFAGLIASNNNLSVANYDQTSSDMKITNVSIKGEKNSVDNTAYSAPSYTGGIYGIFSPASGNAVASESSIAVKAYTAQSAAQLYGVYSPKAGSDDVALVNNVIDTEAGALPLFAKLGSGAASVVTVNGTVGQGVNCGVIPYGAVHNEHISLIVNGTSYWNGKVAASINADEFFTAEELAYVLGAADASAQVTLTNPIDMQGKEVAISPSGSRVAKIDGSVDKLAIKNVVAQQDDSNGYVALFGCAKEVKNLVVENVTVKTKAGTQIFAVAGLAYSAKVDNVDVNGLTIDLVEGSAISAPNGLAKAIGAVVSVATPSSIKNVTVTKANTVNIRGNADIEGKFDVGVVAGRLNIETTHEPVVLDGIKVKGASSVYSTFYTGAIFGSKANQVATYVSDSSYWGAFCPFGQIQITNAQLLDSGKVKAELNAKNCETPLRNGVAVGLAGGISFPGLTQATSVAFTDGEDYGYKFISNVPVLYISGHKVFGFNK